MIPSIRELPGPNAEFRDIVRFAELHDPTAEFRERWGAEYASRVRDLWGGHCAEFASGESLPSGDSILELLLCVNYQIAVAPYTGISPVEVTAFSRWLIGGIRSLLLA